jgi:peptidoglycan/LPS O-acetylase OafA/YrhL
LLAGNWIANWIPLGPSPLRPVPLFYLFLQNYLNLPFGSLIWVWLAVAWSLGVEEQFCLLAPHIIRYLSLQKLRVCSLASLLLAPLLRVLVYFFVQDGRYSIYTWMPCRADSLAFGVLAALLWRDSAICAWYAAHRRLFFMLIAVLLAPLPIFIKWIFVPYTLAMGRLGCSWLALLFTALLLLCLLEPTGR